jgi:integrase
MRFMSLCTKKQVKAKMATIRKRGDYQWQAQIRKNGYPLQSKTFDTKQEAQTWANTIESEMSRGVWQDRSQAEQTTLNDIWQLYENNIVSNLKGYKADTTRGKQLLIHLGKNTPIVKITTVVVATLRDKLSKTYKPTTVLKFLDLLNRTMTYAQIDLGIHLPNGLPVSQIRKPKNGQPRDRRLEQGEYGRLMRYAPEQLKPVIKFALATAMRRGEIAGLTWQDINRKSRYALLSDTKNGTARKAPLSDDALAVIDAIPRKLHDNLIFGYTNPDSITKAFERACESAGIVGLRFHDLRHEAVSRAFECGLNVMEAAAVSGHKDLRMLQRYTHLQPSDIADKLNSKRSAL